MKKLSTHKRYVNLNKNQRFAVDNTEGPLLVIAGPGSGKTELLSLRTAKIIERHDVPLSSILCITFTNAATFNMRERLKGIIGKDANKVSIYTFHSFCLEIINSYPELFFNEMKFDLADEFVKLQVIEEILKELSFDDPLKKVNQQGGFLYLQDIERSIFYLQENAIVFEELAFRLRENEREIRKINKIVHNNFNNRITKEKISNLKSFLEEKNVENNNETFPKLSEVVFRSLREAVLETGRVSEWKAKMTKRKDGMLVIKETMQIEKLNSLVFVYKRYCEEIKKRGYYTFSDIILEVVSELEKNEDLRRDVQEKYLYIQVDEFQDTNGAQMKLLNLITSDTPENKPNICVVGDDDQAIYQFQGADISNILDFQRRYREVKTVVLSKNYRSNQKIIDEARDVVLQVEEHLEINKKLTAGNSNKGGVVANCFLSKEEQFSFIVNEIKKNKLKDVAVISRTHQEIKEVIPYFYASKIPFVVERRENILEKEPIKQIINVLKFSYFLFKKDDYSAESLLPEILTYPFLKVKKEKIWEIAAESQKKKISWMRFILNAKDLKYIGEYFLEVASLLKHSGVEDVFDFIINNKNTNFPNIKNFYFSKGEEDFSFLFSIKSFLKAIKNHQKKRMIKIEDFLSFVDFYQKNEIAILDKNPLTVDEKGVSLVTAHSVKGREFDTVFILNCHQNAWGREKKNRKIIFPANIPVERAGSKKDERIRLFYVAMSRAKRNLYLLNHRKNSQERDIPNLEFLGKSFKEEKEKINIEAVETSFKNSDLLSISASEKKILFSLAKEYKLSATGFNKFLNIVNAGPEVFFVENILRFPQKKTKHSSYGTAVHSLIKETYRVLKKEKKVFSEKDFLHVFKIFLEKERLPEKEFQEMLKRGKKELHYFYKNRIKDFYEKDFVEKDFKNQSCIVNDVIITGKIDKMRVRGESIDVFDYKTGSSLKSWDEKEDNKKTKAWQYKNQLIFYKLLIEHSHDFSKYRVDFGLLDFISSKDGVVLELKMEKDDVERVKKLISIIGKRISSLDFPFIKGKRFKEIIKFENDLLEGKI